MSTGILSDSLFINSVFPFFDSLYHLAKAHPGITFEMRSKTSSFSNIPVNHGKLINIIFSWSVASSFLIAQTEPGLATLQERIQTALFACEHGYKVAFHFDPVIYYPGWHNDYSSLINMILKVIPRSSISYFTIGALRFPKSFFHIIRKKHNSHWIFKDEFVPIYKDTYSYLRTIRKRMYATVSAMLEERFFQENTLHIMEADHAFANLFE